MVLPDSPPKGLSPRQYCKMALQYHLMGNVRQTIRAGRLALAGDRDDFAGTPLEEMSEAELERLRNLAKSLDEGVSFTGRILGGSRIVLDGLKFRILDTADQLERLPVLKFMRYGIEELFSVLGNGAASSAGSLFHSVIVATQPSRDLPQGLEARDYLKLGRRYLDLYWPEQARDALEKVIELSEVEEPNADLEPEPGTDSDSEAVAKEGKDRDFKHSSGDALLIEEARRLIATRLPRNPIPYLAVKRFIDTRRLASIGRIDEARDSYVLILEDYPDFEWPADQLAQIYIQQGEIEKAIAVLSDLVAENPEYAPAYQSLARAYAITGDIFESQTALDKATRLASNPDEISVLRQLITMLARL